MTPEQQKRFEDWATANDYRVERVGYNELAGPYKWNGKDAIYFRFETEKAFQIYSAACQDEAKRAGGLVKALERLRDNGTHHDTCPCRRLHESQPVAAEIDGFWLRYADSMDKRVRQIAAAALAEYKGESK